MTREFTPDGWGHHPPEGQGENELTPVSAEPRIPPGGLRELGPLTWVACKITARVTGVPQMHILTTLGQHTRLFWTWFVFAAQLLVGALPKRDSELVILRVAHLRDCDYELQHHRRMAKRRGLDAAKQEAIFSGPGADGLSDRERALITATDEFVETRNLSPQTWQWLSGHLTRKQLIEFVTLTGQYDALAATMSTLKVPLDFPD